MTNLNKKPAFKLPIITIALVSSILFVYLAYSNNGFFMSNGAIKSLGLLGFQPLNMLTYIFSHVGLLHLTSNLAALGLFGVLVESFSELRRRDVLTLFLLAGTLSGLIFSITNPNTLLVGASASISGFIGASAVAKPKSTVLLAAVLLLVLVGLPFATDFAIQKTVEVSKAKQAELNATVKQLIAQNKTAEALQTQGEVARTVQFVETQQSGQEREKATPPDFLVHVYGTLIGAVYAHFRLKQIAKAKLC